MNITNKGYEWDFPPGTYYLGDPCYVISAPLNPYGKRRNSAFFECKEGTVWVAGTAHGDGYFPIYRFDGDTMKPGQVGNIAVDSGTIGVVPIHLVETTAEKNFRTLGKILRMKEGFSVYEAEGSITMCSQSIGYHVETRDLFFEEMLKGSKS